MPAGREQARWQRWWPLVLLVVAGASRWMLVTARPETETTLASEALGCAWAAMLWIVVAWRVPRIASSSTRGRAWWTKVRRVQDWRIWLGGALLFAGPAAALLVGASEVGSGSMAMALALTPVVVAVAAAALGTAATDGVPGRIWPGLAAVAGLLLVLSQPSLANTRSDLALLLAPLATGVGAALFCADRGPGLPVDDRAAPEPQRQPTALAGGAAFLALAAGVQWLAAGGRPVISLSSVACDGLIALLSVLVLQRLGATRWSAQFVLLPLVVLLEGLLLVRPPLSARWFAGLALLALASISLLLPPGDEPADGPALSRGIL
jgi:drug/metabolite transporter (DMT)-like permease